jgi:hypothetical protein
MITKRIDQLTYADIERLVLEEREPEGRTLDYKRDLPGRTDKEVKEFLADVSSFANASGGHLVFGVTTMKEEGQNTNIPNKIEGVGEINVELEVLRLEQMIRDGIQPRLVTFHVKPLAMADKPTIVVIQIPSSWNAPHIVGKMSPTFFSRTSTGKHPLDVTELRHAFAMSESVGERIKAFRDERIGRILAGETPVLLRSGAAVVLHMIPIGTFSEPSMLDIKALNAAAVPLRPISEGSGWGRCNNLDGVFVSSSPRGESNGYILLFRNGAVEAVDNQMLRWSEERGKGKFIPSRAFEQMIIATANSIYGVMKDLGVAPPLVSFLSLLNVREYCCVTSMGVGEVTHRIDRDHLLLPDILIEESEASADMFLRPAFDMVWQSCGGYGSPYYRTDGRWEAK